MDTTENAGNALSNEEMFEELLNSIEDATITERDKGTRFETLTRDWLMREPTYNDLFTQVQTYKDWAAEHPHLSSNRRDIGIDLVGTNLADGKFTAIQCKFYRKSHTVSKTDVDSFIAVSDRDYFTGRLIVVTSEKISGNLEEELRRLKVPATIITRGTMGRSIIDWSAYMRHEQKTLEKRELRTYQKQAIKDVISGFSIHDRGKLIMACGTGKTFTALRLTEEYLKDRGLVLFLVPSLSLLSQTLTDWKQQSLKPITAFAVCSDTTTGKADNEDTESLTRKDELAYPATTKADDLAKKVAEFTPEAQGLVVIFSTYQSISVISRAQLEHGLPEFDLIVCDEAHRTAGGHLKDEEESDFTRIHDNGYVHGRKRLYMTATPKVYAGAARTQYNNDEIVLYSMEDEKVFGPDFFNLSFNDAVRLNCLVDYQVLVLAIDDSLVGNQFTEIIEQGGFPIKHATKVIGCWKALSKNDVKDETVIADDPYPMKRAVGFAQVIHPREHYDRVSSMQFAEHFQDTVTSFKEQYLASRRNLPDFDEQAFERSYDYTCDCKHIDGSMSAIEKDALISWLKEEPEDRHCKILFNVRCLSEGVDVPALDAVIFLSPRKSQVDVVQTVGRVMRKAPGKKRGYVIIPIAVPKAVDPKCVLDNNKDFDVVWQVLRALKSIDSNFGSVVDGQLNRIDSKKLSIVCISQDAFTSKHKETSGKKPARKVKGKGRGKGSKGNEDGTYQTELMQDHDRIIEETIKSAIVKKIGNRREWGEWAEDVGRICQEQVRQIRLVLDNPAMAEQFAEFREEFRAILSNNLSDNDVIEMLAQHVVIKPVLDALFADYPFTKENPIARAMTEMLKILDSEGMTHATTMLNAFYETVKLRMKNIQTTADRQTVIYELFEKFFKFAFPRLQKKLGIVYTPVEVVDFINHSVNDLLQQEFGVSLADENVHVLDPFTGTGTFITRLMQSSDIIPPDRLRYKYEHDLHAFEIVPLTYYIAAMNVEAVYHEILPGEDYRPNNVTVLTDTFATHGKMPPFITSLETNSALRHEVDKLDIRVIIGNPPYSVGQKSQNDNNQNERYEELEKRLAATYVKASPATLKAKIFDSYIKAFRWASDRIGENGIVAFVTNAGWIDGASADGMRKCFAEEFSDIYVYHMKGNQRTSGETSRKEGGKIFGSGSRAPIAITVLVKNQNRPGKGNIHFACVDDYMTREEKLQTVAKAHSVTQMEFNSIMPDKYGDWLNQRNPEFANFYRMDGKKTQEPAIFKNFSLGVVTSRDFWCFNSSPKLVEENIKTTIENYNLQAENFLSNPDSKIDLDPKKLAWDRPQKRDVIKGKIAEPFNATHIYRALYRPFFKQYLYFDRYWNNCVYQMPNIFPKPSLENFIILVNQSYKGTEFIALMVNTVADLHSNGDAQCFPRYLYQKIDQTSAPNEAGEEYIKYNAISEVALRHFQDAYPGQESEIDADSLFYYIYGILHSQDYRSRYANNLSKELPRIPRVNSFEEFKAFEVAGRRLANLHVNYEKQPLYEGCTIESVENPRYTVAQMKYGKVPGRKGNDTLDKSVILFNSDITIRNVPLEAQEYAVNKKSALDWLIERACVSVDKKTGSGIVNDFNDYAQSIHQDKYIFELVLRIITVSLETLKIVKALPPLEIHPLDMKE